MLGDRDHQRGQSAGGVQQNFARAWVFRIRCGSHHRKNVRENFIRGHTGACLQLSPGGVSALFQNLFPQNGVLPLLLPFFHRSRDRAAPDVVGAALVSIQGAVAASTPDLPIRITANRRGPRTRNKYNDRPFPRCHQGDLQIREYLNRRSREAFLQSRAHPLFHLRLPCSRQSRAQRSNRTAIAPRLPQSKICGFLDFVHRPLHPDAGRIGRARMAARQNLSGLVRQHAIRLRAASIETQNVIHIKSIREKRQTRIESAGKSYEKYFGQIQRLLDGVPWGHYSQRTFPRTVEPPRKLHSMRIHPLDLAIVIAYLLGITALGVRFRRGQQGARDYFLGGRTAPWWALAFSIVATETSTLTIIGTPAISYGGNLSFLQLVFGYLLGRVLIVLLLLPGYFRGEFFTAYALIEKRFGEKMRAVAASTFLITRAIAEGVRVSAIALVVSVVLGTSERLAVFIVIALTVLYTFEGGMKAVIWTDVAQFMLYLSGSLAAFYLLLHKIPGGWETVVHAAAATNKFRTFDFSFSLVNPAKTYTFWSGVIGGGFLTMASHGTDQTIVQRLLAAKSERESKIALLASGVIIFFQFALFLVLGVMLYAWHGAPAIHPGQSYDWVFPDFIVTAMPSGVRGMVIAAVLAVAMSNASGSLNSLASSSVVDFRALRGASISDGGNPARLVRLSRWMTLLWGVILVVLGTLQWGPVLEAGLTIASITFGSLLGLFLLTFLLRRATASGVLTGMFLGLAAMLYIHFYTPLLWTWYVLAGAGITFLAGALASSASGPDPARHETR